MELMVSFDEIKEVWGGGEGGLQLFSDRVSLCYEVFFVNVFK